MKALLIAILLASFAIAEEMKLDTVQIAGRQYEDATMSIEEDGTTVKIVHSAGISRVPIDRFPADIRDKLIPKKVEPEQKSQIPKKVKNPNHIPREERFRIVLNEPVPNGGVKMVIVIAKELTTKEEIEKIIRELKEKYQNQRNAHIYVFDDLRAPSMADRAIADELTSAEESFYDKSFKGVYRKNANTGFHRATITPDGLNGKEFLIDF